MSFVRFVPFFLVHLGLLWGYLQLRIKQYSSAMRKPTTTITETIQSQAVSTADVCFLNLALILLEKIESKKRGRLHFKFPLSAPGR